MLPAVAGGESRRTSCGAYAASKTESGWAHGKRFTGTPRPRTFRCGAGRSPGLRIAAAPSGLPSADGRQWRKMTERLTAHSCGGSPGLAAGRGSPGSLLASGRSRRKNQYRHHSWGTPPFRSSFVNEGFQEKLREPRCGSFPWRSPVTACREQQFREHRSGARPAGGRSFPQGPPGPHRWFRSIRSGSVPARPSP